MVRVLVVNDLHVGSDVSIMPKNVNLGNGIRIKANGIQKHLYTQWQNMCNKVEPDVCICNGDLCDGNNPADKGRGLWTADPELQSDVAAELLSMIDADAYHITTGSDYHTGVRNGYNCDKMTADKLGGTFDDETILNYSGVRMHVRHETGYTKVPYTRSNPLNQDMVNTVLNNEEYGEIDIFLRAHTHYAHAVMWKYKLGIINGCWKYKDSFIRKRQNSSCDICYTVLDLDDGEYSFKMNKIDIPQNLGQCIREHGVVERERWYNK